MGDAIAQRSGAAARFGTISYALLCGFGRRYARVWRR
jgi:hypothetical protein